MKLIACYNTNGKIVSLTKVDDKKGIPKISIIPPNGCKASEVILGKSLKKKNIVDLHSKYKVSTKGKISLIVKSKKK